MTGLDVSDATTLISDLGGEATRTIVQRLAALAPSASIQVPE
jgi:hypothetical protein